jgi:cytochrome c1
MNPTAMKTFLPALAIGLMIVGCGGGASEKTTPPGAPAPEAALAPPAKGKMITLADITMGDIDQGMVAKGKAIYDMKCLSCHSLGENRIVGPGWKGVTHRRDSPWIMNMIMNTEAMLSDDPEAQKLLEQCLVRMPNQNLDFNDARNVLELMRTL